MSMKAEAFFTLLLDEIASHQSLQGYYRFLNDPAKESFRKAYYLQRLKYIERHLDELGSDVWDCGCGYGTTNLFLAMNGIRSFGNTLEYYYDEIPRRLQFWSQHGDTGLFKFSYADTFDLQPTKATYSAIIAQDTLHHLEPLSSALQLFNQSLQPNGILLGIEENGSNLIQRAKLFKQRGFKRVIQYHDEKLNKTIVMGNENIRPVKRWRKLMEDHGFHWQADALEYVRILPPRAFEATPAQQVIDREQKLIRTYPVLKKYFSFGINFIARKA